MSDNNFVVYAYVREDGTPYYIGKGRPRRPFTSGGRPCATPPKERIILLHENLEEDEAFTLETKYILKYGRKDIDPESGLLLNKTNGGEGASGAIRSQEFKDNLSAKRSGPGNHMYRKKHTEESKRLISEKLSGKNNPQYGKRGKLSPNWGVKFSEEHRRKISEANSGKNNPSYGKRGELSPNWGVKFSEERRRKISEAISGKNHPRYGKRGELSPNFGRKHTEETKRRISESRKGNKHPNYNPRDWAHDVHGIVLSKSCSELVEMFPNEKLNRSCLSQVALGRYKQHKGWKAYNP